MNGLVHGLFIDFPGNSSSINVYELSEDIYNPNAYQKRQNLNMERLIGDEIKNNHRLMFESIYKFFETKINKIKIVNIISGILISSDFKISINFGIPSLSIKILSKPLPTDAQINTDGNIPIAVPNKKLIIRALNRIANKFDNPNGIPTKSL